MASEGSVTHWIQGVKTGDEDAAEGLWKRYFQKLLRIAEVKLRSHPRRASDEEDVVLSAMESFFRGAREGRFQELRDRDNLWPLLVLITARKASDHIEHDRRQKRGGGRVVGESAFDSPIAPDAARGIEQVIGKEPTPEFASLVMEECERLLDGLDDDTLRPVAQLKLEGHTNKEVAGRLDVSLRTVERKLWVIRSKWSHLGASDG